LRVPISRLFFIVFLARQIQA
jgi:hypothetical protein